VVIHQAITPVAGGWLPDRQEGGHQSLSSAWWESIVCGCVVITTGGCRAVQPALRFSSTSFQGSARLRSRDSAKGISWSGATRRGGFPAVVIPLQAVGRKTQHLAPSRQPAIQLGEAVLGLRPPASCPPTFRRQQATLARRGPSVQPWQRWVRCSPCTAGPGAAAGEAGGCQLTPVVRNHDSQCRLAATVGSRNCFHQERGQCLASRHRPAAELGAGLHRGAGREAATATPIKIEHLY